eukprot:TRINITY_DN13037_c0_g1_i1.p1 TRINITY_DN13037_c0_g1~~TRINITY_DN13037_c0_g1_i1.p1  ORF type:complete len:405 (+),score=98.83 TRINITY_DN13037_c0_g1_i1:115-1329(+)
MVLSNPEREDNQDVEGKKVVVVATSSSKGKEKDEDEGSVEAEEDEGEMDDDEMDYDDFEDVEDDFDSSFDIDSSAVFEEVRRERHQKELAKVKEVRNQCGAIMTGLDSTNNNKIKKTIENLDDTFEVLGNYLSDLQRKKYENEEAEIREVMNEVVAMKLQLEDYIKQALDDETQRLINELSTEDASSPPSDSISSMMFKKIETPAWGQCRAKPVVGFTVEDSTAFQRNSNTLASDTPFFAPRIVTMAVLRVATRGDITYLTLQDDPFESKLRSAKVRNLANPSSFVQKNILVLTNADTRVILPLLIIRDSLQTLITVGSDVPLGRIACPLGYTCRGNQDKLVSRELWATYSMNTTQRLKSGNREIALMMHSFLLPSAMFDPIVKIVPEWGNSIVDVDWDMRNSD